MEKSDGRLIVLDGLDGSGKTTQFEMVVDWLRKKYGEGVKGISFPDYGHPSSSLVKLYLSGALSEEASGVNSYAASSFYAVDRYASYKLYWEGAYLDGEMIIASRYTTSNAIHQMMKLPKEEWDSFLEWLWDYEYEKLGLPRPDKVIFLDMPLEVAIGLLEQRNATKGEGAQLDIHERDRAYLKACRTCGLYVAEKQGWNVVECVESGRLLSREELFVKITEIITEV